MHEQHQEYSDEAKRIESLTNEARELYDERLPYHNFEHALKVLERVEAIVARCQTENVPINIDVVRYAALFHDAGYIEDHRALGYESKESYAAALARPVLTSHGLSASTIANVERTIMATQLDAILQSNEDKAMRAADIGNLQGDYEEFVDSNRRLKAEAELLGGRPITWATWKHGTEDIVNRFLAMDIRLTSQHDDGQGNSTFHSIAKKNLDRFLADPEFSDQ